ncbi:MAG TPA: C40 family peptidase [Macromonas sp.]|nr:C40 family peptidase [Macromonas sp.]
MQIFRKMVATAVLCAVASQAWSDPVAKVENPTPLLNGRGLLSNLDGVRQSVGQSASQLVLYAMGFMGVPYARGGNSAETGFDCSGFVRTMYEQSLGKVLPRRAAEQAKATLVISKNDLKPGDLVFFNTMRRTFSHVGIYIGDGKFIHSPRTGSEVRIEDMNQTYWLKRFNGARRVEEEAPLPTDRQTP